jgi:hypothetical protein
MVRTKTLQRNHDDIGVLVPWFRSVNNGLCSVGADHGAQQAEKQ